MQLIKLHALYRTRMDASSLLAVSLSFSLGSDVMPSLYSILCACLLLAWLPLVTTSTQRNRNRNLNRWQCFDHSSPGGYLGALGHMIEKKSFHQCMEMLERPVLEEEPQEFQTVENRKVKVFSAYYDPRPAAEGPTIRLLAIGWQAEYRYVGYLYCQLWYEHRAQPVVTLAKYDRIYPSVAWHEMWCSHFILCKLQDTIAIPYAVSIVPEPCRKPKNSLLILNRLSNTNKGQHALCLPLVYGKWDSPLPFIESLELHRILGVQKVTMYLKEDIPILNPVIHHYINTGFLEVVIWKIPNLPCSYFFQRAALNDCLYRNMNNFKFVAVNDVDEVLVPRMTDTWPELMSIIDRPDRGAFLFQHVYFRRNHTLKMDPQLISQTSYYRTIKVFPPGRIRCKTLYKAESSLKLDVHSSYQLLRGVHEYILSPEEGLLHHYRPQPFSSAHEKPEYNNFMEDRFMEKYKERLIKAVVDTHNKVMT